ncbi:MerR family transcriptional regulator [Cytobacillus spongiae]|uniref:MerR family transcriptional regulator n=1 Tax=Cytobacillus spongiae TaxID=2901381 RepID=UPI001F20F951|nr:MerR family transcriptional regulator [Cytobacillus spongiae]UII57762.1 MerR family transcriptional regulator [Cytobacillus spongiae]
MKKSYQIGTFAKMTGMTVRALHYYDEIGLLKPHLADNGRRFYDDVHFIPLQKIVTLKFLGFPLDQIKETLQNEHWKLRDSFIFQRKIVEEKRKQLDHMLKALDHAIYLEENHKNLDPSIFISIISGIKYEEEHKEWLRTIFSEEKIEDIFNKSEKEQLELEIKWAKLLSEIKRLYGREASDPEVSGLTEQLLELFNEVVGEELSSILQMSEAELPEDPTSPLPLTDDETEWLRRLIEPMLAQNGEE